MTVSADDFRSWCEAAHPESPRAGRDWGLRGQHVRRQFISESAKCPNFQMMRTGSRGFEPSLTAKIDEEAR